MLPGIAFLLMLKDNGVSSRKRYAAWFIIGYGVGLAAYCVLAILSGAILSSIIGTVVALLITYYFYLCLRSYAKTANAEKAFKIPLLEK